MTYKSGMSLTSSELLSVTGSSHPPWNLWTGNKTYILVIMNMSHYTGTIVLNQTDAGVERGKSKGRGASARASALE